MKWLLDTCVISEFVKPVPEPRIVNWLRQQVDDDLALSVLTLGEIEKGIHRLSESSKKSRLLKWLESDVLNRFEGRLLDVDVRVAKEWARVQAQSELKGRPLSAVDGLLASTALVHKLTFVTRDIPGVEATGVSILNPWES